MPNDLTPERAHCLICGFPLRGSRCAICNDSGEPRSLEDGHGGGAFLEPIEADLIPAYEALGNKDLIRFIGHVVSAEGGASVRTAASPEGPGWIAFIRGAVVFVAFNPAEGKILLQAPIARLPQRQHVPVLRLALELSARRRIASRPCLRDDLLLLRSSARTAVLTPPTLRRLLREIGQLSARYTQELVNGFDARPAIPEGQHAVVTFDLLDQARKLNFGPEVHRSSHLITERSTESSAVPRAVGTTSRVNRSPASPSLVARMDSRSSEPASTSAPSIPIPPSLRREDGAAAPPDSAYDDLPPVLAPLFATPSPGAVAPGGFEERRGGRTELKRPPSPAPDEDLPPVLAPLFGDRRRDSRTEPIRRLTPAPDDALPPVLGPLPEQGRRDTLATPIPAVVAPELPPVLGPLPEQGRRDTLATPIPAVVAPAIPAAPMPEDRRREARTVSQPIRRPTPPPGSLPTLTFPFSKATSEIELDAPSRKPSRTGSVTTLETPTMPGERLMAFLVKAQSLATLVLDTRPATMTWLVRATVFRAIYEHKREMPDAVAHLYRCTGMGRDPAEPALLVIERVANARGVVPKEKPLIVEPLSTAAQAKEHIGRYLAEIGRAPADPSLRHFLALGALSELLVRTRLSAQTDQRLRDIVNHALREGPKPSAIDLMMTALERIAGG